MVTIALTSLPMRRALVLTNESARHPFRASLPAHVLQVEEEIEPVVEPEVAAAMVAKTQETPLAETVGDEVKPSFWQLTRSDVRGFATTYLASFLAVLVFIM